MLLTLVIPWLFLLSHFKHATIWVMLGEGGKKLLVFSSDCSGALAEKPYDWVWCLIWQTQWQTSNSSSGKSGSAFSGIHGETLDCSAATRALSDRATSPQVQTQMDIKENSDARSSCDNTCMCTRVWLCVHGTVCPCPHAYTLCPCTCVFVSFYELMSRGVLPPRPPPDWPLSPPVFAPWSKPLPCHRSFWCSGTIEPVEVLISSSIQLHKGQASPPSPVQWAGGGKDPGRTLEVPCLQACLVRVWTSEAKAAQA